MRCVLILVCLFALQASSFPHESRREEEEARILSEVWDAMDKHRGDDIIVVPRHDESGPSEHHSDTRSSEHGGSHESSHESSHEGPHDSSSHSESEKLPEPEAQKQSENLESEKSEESKESSSESKSEESEKYRPFDKVWGNLDRLGNMMSRAVDRLRQDDREIRDLETEGSSSNGLTVFILEIVGGAVVALIVIIIVVVGSVKGVNKFKSWKARRESARLVDQENPNMDATGYQSGFNP